MKSHPVTKIVIGIMLMLSTHAQLIGQIPTNDSPCFSDANPPIDLTEIHAHYGTTCEATYDYDNVDCSQENNESSVWYYFDPADDQMGYTVIVESIDSETPIIVEIYSGTIEQGCEGFGQTIASSCDSENFYTSITNCLTEDEQFFIKVTTKSSPEFCKSFFVNYVAYECSINTVFDDCIETLTEDPIQPVTNLDFQIDYSCFSNCLQFACPEVDDFGGCFDFVNMPTVWFHVQTDEFASQLLSTVTTNGNWEPIWAVFEGSCDSLNIVTYGGSPMCSAYSSTPNLLINAVHENSDYWVAVTCHEYSLPPNGIIDDGSFEICVATMRTAIDCLGELESGECNDPSLIMEVTDREFELPIDTDNDGIAGPFYPGEEVDIKISFFYDSSQSGLDHFIGLIPIFGDGWDLSNFDYTTSAPKGNGAWAQWYQEGADCAPIIQEPTSILCTYTNEEGKLEICNKLCEDCDQCPDSGMEPGDQLPSGYFWVSQGQNLHCANDCSPGQGWGLAYPTTTVTWKFSLKVKEFTTEEECDQKRDLSIRFQTLSAGIAGCWEDPVAECFLDQMMFSPEWETECIGIATVNGDNQSFCESGITNINLQTADGSAQLIKVDVEDNPFVTGENSYNFIAGEGTIVDTLHNTTNEYQEVIYSVYVFDPVTMVPGPTKNITVGLHPQQYNSIQAKVIDQSCGGEEALVQIIAKNSIEEPIQNLQIWGECPRADLLETFIESNDTILFLAPIGDYSCFTFIAYEEGQCSDTLELAIEIIDGYTPEITGTNQVCYLDTSILIIENSEFFDSIIWPEEGISNFDTCLFVLDTTTTLEIKFVDTLGCTSIENYTIEVLELGSDYCYDPCDNQISTYQITGYAYSDVNQNGIFDSLDIPLANVQILGENGTTVFTNPLGEYILPVEMGIQDIVASIPFGSWQANTKAINDINVNEACISNQNIGFISTLENLGTEIFVSNSQTRCNFTPNFYVTVVNNNHNSISGVVEFNKDPLTSFEAITIPGATINNDILIFDTGVIPPLSQKTYKFNLKMPLGSSSLPTLHFKANVYVSGNVGDSYEYSEQLLCSYDPNDKREHPQGVGNERWTLLNTKLDYTIRFQNNGNDTAYHVQIRDVLDSNIDHQSIRVINASHPVRTTISGDTLIFDFPNINLVDSTTNYIGSQGFITFSCDHVNGIAEFTPIFNQANIYFDENEPIITNQTLNTIVGSLCQDVLTTIDTVLCQGESYLGYNTPGLYTLNYEAQYGCDSTILLFIETIDYVSQHTNFEVCEGDSISINSMTYSIPQSGEYTFDFYNEGSECKYLQVVADITVYENEAIEIDSTICEGMSVFDFDETGIYTIEEADEETGCIITTYLDLTVLPASHPDCSTSSLDLQHQTIYIYPNPVTDRIYIESNKSIESISFFTSDYRLVDKYKNFDKKAQIDMSSFQDGLYFVRIETNKGIVFQKVYKY